MIAKNLHVCTYARLHTYESAVRSHAHTHARTYTHTHAHARTHARTHTHRQTHIHTHATFNHAHNAKSNSRTCIQCGVQAVRGAVSPHRHHVRRVSEAAGTCGSTQRLPTGRLSLSLRHADLQPHLRQLGIQRPRAEPVGGGRGRGPQVVHHARRVARGQPDEPAGWARVFRCALPSGMVACVAVVVVVLVVVVVASAAVKCVFRCAVPSRMVVFSSSCSSSSSDGGGGCSRSNNKACFHVYCTLFVFSGVLYLQVLWRVLL